MNDAAAYDSAPPAAPAPGVAERSPLLLALQSKLLAMPPVRAMNLQVAGFRHGRLCLQAPLADNVNDKGCAFGGSLAGLMTLAGWGAATLSLQQAGLAADVYVQDSQVRYLLPLYADLRAEAGLAAGADWADFIRSFRDRGKARASLCAEIRDPEGRLAASFEGRFVALRPG